MKKLKTYFLASVATILFFAFISCDYVAPNVSKAQSEKEQIEELKKQNQLLEEQNKQLKRIADALERMPESR